MIKEKNIIVLLSGGMDSATLLWLAKQNFEEVYAISFIYGQKHSIEIEYAKELAKIADVKQHFIVELPHLKQLGKSALTDPSLEVPSQDYTDQPPITTVPMRNLTFLSIAAAFADVYEIENIGIGIHSLDSPYPDCRAEFASAAEAAINASSVMVANKKNRIKIYTPFLGMSKVDIAKLGYKLGVPFEKTYSCYKGTNPPCGECATCRQREEALKSIKED
ncbi:7-cyano-7-deazaguanine synthase QueC [Sulfurihydrogenibium azorense]|jgi:7-cyano-7-deazaguanine synthase|uniref:7-cyano-7-deazaguanine synthase n=1 Tax=Sulfurihydrogenibium azorense (strain DSM 15241 / OCM 825 / Az-Fu1) TaxID=204536 RepID=C1DXP6_SULAA|nr:7-cyano-7-deazaguanine synthase QueC [Sulfurihydrogenibium azorense]ACN99742.1 ExsB protein [Sulfurihydrogenibium azorense Az-Fu1]MDM7273424.1 7-cyano-7-deazaguanine synthase QueC [Sulfurihydrogenibium azorense]